MLLKILVSYLLGYVTIKVEGMFLERFINICTSKRIFLWGAKRKKATLLYTNISIGDYKKIRPICKKTKSTVEIRAKKGLPFILHRYRKRKIFVGLLAIFFIALFALSRFIWNIEITGNTEVSSEEIVQILAQEGLKIGSAKSKIDTTSLINKARLKIDNLAWIGIEIVGTNAKISLRETKKAPVIVDREQACDIMANKTGIITAINVQEGTAMAKEGDIVREGDILVKGFIEGKYTETRYVHSMADVKAKVWYSKKAKESLKQEITRETGNTESKYCIMLKNFRINLYKTLSNFENYDTIKETKNLKLFSDFYLPIQVIKMTNKEREIETVIYTEETLVEKLKSDLRQELNEEIADTTNIVNEQVNVKKDGESIEVELIYEVLESIGIEQEVKNE